jgi:tetratricopeptide (TPR) repeat protein
MPKGNKKMMPYSICKRVAVAPFLLAFGLACMAGPQAQQDSNPRPSLRQPGSQPQQQPASNPGAPGQPPQATPAGQPEAPKLNPQEEADYKALYDADDADKKIQLSQDFLQKYPDSVYTMSVYDELANAYYFKHDWNNLYATGDKVAAKYPANVDVLILVGWVIPHFYDEKDPDAAKKLAKAEMYEKHAIQVIPLLPQPPGVSDDQFAATKMQKLSQAHGALGLVYFWRQDYDDSVKELQQATQPDATDYYVLAMSEEKLKRFADAADSFQKCGQTAGTLQDHCKQGANRARGEVAQPK